MAKWRMTTERMKLLETYTDAQLARKWQVKQKLIKAHRDRARIPEPTQKIRMKTPHDTRSTLPDEIIAKLGTMPDRELAEIAGCAFNTIWRARKERGIESHKRVEKSVTPEAIADLGKRCDAAWAATHGHHTNYAWKLRKKHGIPAFSGRTRLILPDEIIAKLGTISDIVLAAEAGCSTAHIYRERKRLNIDASPRRKPGPKGKPVKKREAAGKNIATNLMGPRLDWPNLYDELMLCKTDLDFHAFAEKRGCGYSTARARARTRKDELRELKTKESKKVANTTVVSDGVATPMAKPSEAPSTEQQKKAGLPAEAMYSRDGNVIIHAGKEYNFCPDRGIKIDPIKGTVTFWHVAPTEVTITARFVDMD